MPVYKFLHSAHIDRLLVDGTIRISSLSHFRRLESKQSGIADLLEASTVVTFEHFTKTGDINDFAPNLRTGPNTVVRLNDSVVITHAADCFIFCASHGELHSLSRLMCSGDEPYDACVKIIDLRLLEHRIFHRGTILELDNTKVKRVFTHVVARDVVYQPVKLTIRTGDQPPSTPTPLTKGEIFSFQRETRIVLEAAEFRGEAPFETLTIKIPHPEQVFVEEFRKIDTTHVKTPPLLQEQLRHWNERAVPPPASMTSEAEETGGS